MGVELVASGGLAEGSRLAMHGSGGLERHPPRGGPDDLAVCGLSQYGQFQLNAIFNHLLEQVFFHHRLT